MIDRDTDFAAYVFNQGSDARIAGQRLGANPYPQSDPMHGQWMRGWLDADTYWGKWARRPVRPLVEVG